MYFSRINPAEVFGVFLLPVEEQVSEITIQTIYHSSKRSDPGPFILESDVSLLTLKLKREQPHTNPVSSKMLFSIKTNSVDKA